MRQHRPLVLKVANVMRVWYMRNRPACCMTAARPNHWAGVRITANMANQDQGCHTWAEGAHKLAAQF